VSSILIAAAFFGFMLVVGARPAHAQPPSPPASAGQGQEQQQPPAEATAASSSNAAAQAPAEDDDERLNPSEPDFSIINLPSNLRLPKFKFDFHLMHRFNENLRNDSFDTQFQNLFGLDQGATIGLEFRFGVWKHLQAVVQRTNLGRTMQFQGKYDGWHQSASFPLSISGIIAAEGTNNFGACSGCGDTAYAQSYGAVVSREFGDRGAVYLEPFFVHNTGGLVDPGRNTGFLGIGMRGRVHGDTYLVFEVSPRMGGLVLADGSPEYSFGIEKRVGGHVFQLVFGNGQGMTFAQIARGGNPEALYFGFNLSRKFY
jgi:hypothetical protein